VRGAARALARGRDVLDANLEADRRRAVRQVLGREPRDFADFAGEAAAAGTWKV
jgi:hypothetical protein